ncbi:tRNA pseudouridine(38-40) synthase TruA, partial [Achromobacter anxifer]|nr:tRNA pseudouridine(38-40) synthase TruA [Achromobacter anxifer]
YLSAIDYPEEFGLDELDGGSLLLSPFTQTY